MVHNLVDRFRAILRGRNWNPDAAGEGGGVELCEPDPEWDELLSWAREETTEQLLSVAAFPVIAKVAARSEPDEEEWEWIIARAKAELVAPPVPRVRLAPPPIPADDEASEWARLIQQAKASTPVSVPVAAPVSVPPSAPVAATAPARPRPSVTTRGPVAPGSIASLAERLERLAARLPASPPPARAVSGAARARR